MKSQLEGSDDEDEEVFEKVPVPEVPEIVNEKIIAIGWNNKIKMFMVGNKRSKINEMFE